MTTSLTSIRRCIQAFDFNGLFIEELGWNHLRTSPPPVEIDGTIFTFTPIAEKFGFQVVRCSPAPDGIMPDRPTRQKIDNQLAKHAQEHLIVFTDANDTMQQWQWALREPERPVSYREVHFNRGDHGERLAQKLQHLFVSIEDEDRLTVVDVAGKAKQAFQRDKVTKKFYDRFDKERKAFMPTIDGIPGEDDRAWYASIMLNRLMFVYFIQKKGFLNGDPNYLRNKLREVRRSQGPDQFYGYYREFLLKLFHEGLAKQKPHTAEIEQLLGDVPYLNGGIFDIHQIEQVNQAIQIPDEAFEKIFAFFDDYDWHLDERPLRDDSQINPDVLGYIFEKYINQKQMGAYYTKEDITEYISKNTIVPFLFDAAKQDCAIAFRPDGSVWGLLQDNPDRYIYDAVQTGVRLDIPPDILAGKDDIAKRGGWNRPSAGGYGLPTETWREYMARRARYDEIGGKLLAGEVTSIDDLITYNLDIRQFAQDVIQHAEGPELVRAFYKAIREVSVLDPTCGSGAFLFAALNILHPLYDACLERMEEFVDALDRNPEPQHPNKYSDFRAALNEVGQHASRDYFIFKSIIARNLYGVDIMEEAVEICKLRLFLKLASKLEPGQPIEPLPDIDFNIRAGNTLVGFTSIEDVRRAALMSSNGNMRLALPDDLAALDRLEEQAAIADRAFAQFREQQTTLGGAVTAADKAALRSHLRTLSDELDRYLARLYGIFQEHSQSSLDYQQRFTTWRESHQPFHWLIDFYGIMQRGGFDVIIGNPPYLERSKLKNQYAIINYVTESCRDIYAWVVERCFRLRARDSAIGLIIPVSFASSGSFKALRNFVDAASSPLWVSHFANRPGQLFNGAQNRLSILISGPTTREPATFSTHYHRWDAKNGERDSLFTNLRYVSTSGIRKPMHGLIPKAGSLNAVSTLNKIDAIKTIRDHVIPSSGCSVFWVRVPGYFCQFFLDQPKAVPESGGPARVRGEVNDISLRDEATQRVLHAALNSSTYYQFFSIYTDGRHINPSDVYDYPFDLATMSPETVTELCSASRSLENCFSANTSQWRKSGLLIDSVDSKGCKPIIDEIDRVLAEHYGFTDEELDFIINYDIKYRMGRDGLAGDDGDAGGDG